MSIRSLLRYFKQKRKKKHRYDGVATTPSFFNYVFTKRRGLDEALPNLEVVAIGSSLADYGFYSPSWTESFNFGLTSGDLSVALQQYEKVLRHAPHLKVVLLYSGIFMLGFNLACTSERNRLVLYKHFFAISYNEVNEIQSDAEQYVMRKIDDFPFEICDSDQGYIYDKSYLSNANISARAEKHLKENQREPDQMDYFLKLKDLVESDGKKFYLIVPPVRFDFREVLKNMGGEDLFEKFRSIMPLDRILDFYEDKEFTLSDFGDCDHMSRSGAKKLTAKIHAQISI